MNKLQIIFCTDGIFPNQVGGMQKHSRLLIENLAKTQKIDIVVIHPHQENVFDIELKIIEERIEPINNKKNYLLECYQYSKRVFQIIQKYPNHIVYSQGLSVWYKIAKIKSSVIVNPHGLEPFQSLTVKEKIIAIPFKIIFNYIFKNADRVVSLGGKLTTILNNNIKNGKTKIVELPNAVELPKNKVQRNFSNEKLKILFIARFAHNKGIHILLETVKELNESGFENKFEFNLGGKGPLFDYYSKNINYKNVNYLGFVSDEQLVDLYRNNDLFAFPTLFEGMPTVVLEAMSFAMPIIVSDVGATAELVDEGNGFLIKKNSVQELKNAILKFYKLPITEKQKLSEKSYNYVQQKFTWNIVAEKHYNLFQTL